LLYGEDEEIHFEGDFSTWEAAAAQCTGYDAENILVRVLDATLKVKRGVAVFERDSVLFDEIEYSWPVLAGLLWTAARNSGRLNVLDFGGALGSSYFQNRKFLHALPEVRWNIVEQAHWVKAGQAYVQDEHLRFYETIEECVEKGSPNVIVLSGVLQCLPDPYRRLSELLAVQASTVIIDRTPYLNHGNEERITIQHVPESIYLASYPCRFFVERRLRDSVTAWGYRLVEEFESLDRLAPIATWKGHIFESVTHA